MLLQELLQMAFDTHLVKLQLELNRISVDLQPGAADASSHGCQHASSSSSPVGAHLLRRFSCAT
jgi:hypothetical protein